MVLRPCYRHFTDSYLAGAKPRPVECRPRGCCHSLIYHDWPTCPMGKLDERNKEKRK